MAARLAGICMLALALVQQGAPAPQPPRAAVEAEGHEGDVHEDMDRLVLDIERRLRSIDELLLRAGSPEARPAARGLAAASLEGALERGRQALEDIDRLLEIAEHPHPPGGS